MALIRSMRFGGCPNWTTTPAGEKASGEEADVTVESHRFATHDQVHRTQVGRRETWP